MAIQLNVENGGKILVVHVSGKLAKADYEYFVPEFERLVVSVQASRMVSVDGRFIPGLRAISSPVTNWQGEAEVAVTLLST